MHVRITVFEGDPARIDDLVAFVRDRGVAHVRSLAGNLGLTMTADRAGGRCEVAVPFASLETLLESTNAVGPMRDVGAAIMTARANPEVLKVLRARHRDLRDQDFTGGWQGTVRLSLEAGSSGDVARILRETAAPKLLERTGVRAVDVLANGSAGTLTLTCPGQGDAAAALASAVVLCAEIPGVNTVDSSLQQIVIDARPVIHEDPK